MAPVALRYLLALLILMSVFLIVWYARENQLYWTENKIQGIELLMREKIIQERLHQSEILWRRGIFSREKAEIESRIAPDKPWVPVSYRSIWDFFYPTFNCPHSVERIGRVGDGGKWVCGVTHIEKSGHPCVAFSYGVKDDISFEVELLNRTKCTLYAFDYTVNESDVGLSNLFPDRSSFYKIGLGHQDSGVLRTLKTEMKLHRTKFIDILKIDVEGGEYQIIPEILKDFPTGLPFGQLLIEIHLEVFPQNDLYNKFKDWWVPLEKAGLRPFSSEPNLFPVIIAQTRPTYYEFSFLNTKVDHMVLHA